MKYFSKNKKWMAYLILLTFLFTSIMPSNLGSMNSIAEAAITPESVDVVNSAAAGITITMTNIPGSDEATRPFRNGGWIGGAIQQGLVELTLEDGYPKLTEERKAGSYNQVVHNKRSLKDCFSNADGYPTLSVNGLFLQSEYDETGYYHYSSFDNSAILNNGKLEVYRELMTPEPNTSDVLYGRGNFLPYNNFSQVEESPKQVRFDENGGSISNGRTDLYVLKRKAENSDKTCADFHFGMTVSAAFTQPQNGWVTHTKPDGTKVTDKMRYEFTGDDDLWVFIDNVLILDLGGVHVAHSGSIDFATGVVEIDGEKDTTIGDQFRLAYRNDSAKLAEAEKSLKNNTFADFTEHTIKIFYMERGEGASDLKMRFNLPTVPANPELQKIVEVNEEFINPEKEYQFDVKVSETGAADGADAADQKAYTGRVIILDQNDAVVSDGTISDGAITLKHGETAALKVDKGEFVRFEETNGTDDFTKHNVTQTDPATGNQVTLENWTGETGIGKKSDWHQIEFTNAGEKKLFYQFFNTVNKADLTITKQLDEGLNDNNTEFQFKVYFKNYDAATKTGVGEYDLVKQMPEWTLYKGDWTLMVKDQEANEYVVSGDVKEASDGYIYLNADEKAVLKDIPVGTEYFITEVLDGSEYVVKEATTNIEITEADGKKVKLQGVQGSIDDITPVNVTITNTKYGSIEFTKTNEDGTVNLGGAVFALYKQANANDEGAVNIGTAANPVYAIATGIAESSSSSEGTKGKVEFNAIPFGNYYLKETVAPTGYSVSGILYPVTVASSDPVVLGADGKITNKPNVSVTVTKKWDDANNQDGIRPANVTVQLKQNGANYGDPVTLTNSYTWTNLPAYVAGQNGVEAVYSVEETMVGETALAASVYTSTITGNAANGFVITNSYTPEKTSVRVTKNWSDNDNQDGLRDTVTVALLANGEPTGETKTLGTTNGATATFEDLAVYANGEAIVYTVEETMVGETALAASGYEATITGNAANGFVITNSHTPKKTEVAGTKTWVDGNNQHGLRPADITLTLYADGELVKGAVPTWTKKGNVWNYEYTGLPMYAGSTTPIVYTVVETAVSGYTTTYSADKLDITNTIAQDYTSVSGTKTWIAPEGTVHPTITINLLRDGVVYKEVQLKDGETSYLFKDLPKYDLEDGHAYEYTVAEEDVKGYTSEQNGTDFTNTIAQQTVTVGGQKIWQNVEGVKVPETITVELFRDGQATGITTTASAADWTYKFENLPRYAVRDITDESDAKEGLDVVRMFIEFVSGDKNEFDGHEYVYSVEEVKVEGFTAYYDQKVEENGNVTVNITNVPEGTKIPIKGQKLWFDASDVTTHQSITIELWQKSKESDTLYSNERIDSIKLPIQLEDGSYSWEYDFGWFDKFDENGEPYHYYVKEAEVPAGYISVVSGYNVHNVQMALYEMGHITVTKDVEGTPASTTEFDFTLVVKATERISGVLDKAQQSLQTQLATMKQQADERKKAAETNLDGAEELFESSTFVTNTSASAYQFYMVDSGTHANLAVTTGSALYVEHVDMNLTPKTDLTDEEKNFFDNAMATIIQIIDRLADEFLNRAAAESEALTIADVDADQMDRPGANVMLTEIAQNVEVTSGSALAFEAGKLNGMFDAMVEHKQALVEYDNVMDAVADFTDGITTASAIVLIVNGDIENPIELDPESGKLNEDGLVEFEVKVTEDRDGKATIAEKVFFDPKTKEYQIPFTLLEDGTIDFSLQATTGSAVQYYIVESDVVKADKNYVDTFIYNGEDLETDLAIEGTLRTDWNTITSGSSIGYIFKNLYEEDTPPGGGFTPEPPKKPEPPKPPEEIIDDPEVPLDAPEVPEEPVVVPGEEIPEPEVPLGDAPATGDAANAVPFMVLMMFALCGLVITRRKFN